MYYLHAPLTTALFFAPMLLATVALEHRQDTVSDRGVQHRLKVQALPGLPDSGAGTRGTHVRGHQEPWRAHNMDGAGVLAHASRPRTPESLGLALLERLEARHGRHTGSMGRTSVRLLVLFVLVIVMMVPMLAVFLSPATTQKCLDEVCCFPLRVTTRTEALGFSKGPMPAYGALKKGSRQPAMKKKVSFSEAPPSVSSMSSARVEHVESARYYDVPHAMSTVAENPALKAAAPSSSPFTSPVVSENDLVTNK
mmetsp:Transcript_52538/g.122207  ORF Transcript_52538/g.122207 Transcript_52538/m.122207 type:complete len:253 (+) Transcript_52538:55-813(+)|eukprot:CAMPEP_0171109902 /NCGR_PEP_ID=MMETSP0766_2-20121228/71049_1 /TAXON_ID=439317 /ORGANISM="Gambierdiscus australes, Strain CAWD 149" /LENGTH=252 /DNA_ID=CAMNT_0011571707 /DNA_START=52 /DNA_END=810 /DNA_ORIENTATION=-